MFSLFKSKKVCKALLASRVILWLLLLSITLLSCKNDSDGFEQCLGPDLNDLLQKLERRLEVLLAENYGRRDVGLPEYKRFVGDWNTDQAKEIFHKVQGSIDEETGHSLINNPSVRKIVNWSTEMGDSTWLYTPEAGEQLVNEIRFNYQDEYKSCLEASRDSLAVAYLAVKDLGDPQYRAITDFLLLHFEKTDTNYDLLKQLILIELYLRPLASKHLEL